MPKNQLFLRLYQKSLSAVDGEVTPTDGSSYIQISDLCGKYGMDENGIRLILSSMDRQSFSICSLLNKVWCWFDGLCHPLGVVSTAGHEMIHRWDFISGNAAAWTRSFGKDNAVAIMETRAYGWQRDMGVVYNEVKFNEYQQKVDNLYKNILQH